MPLPAEGPEGAKSASLGLPYWSNIEKNEQREYFQSSARFHIGAFHDSLLPLHPIRSLVAMVEKGKDKDNEHNYVADAQNWEARVKGELESARVSPSIENLHSIRLIKFQNFA